MMMLYIISKSYIMCILCEHFGQYKIIDGSVHFERAQNVNLVVVLRVQTYMNTGQDDLSSYPGCVHKL